MSFTSVPQFGQAQYIAGMWADSDQDQDSVSGFSEEATNQIAFGTAVVPGVAPQGVKIPSGGGDVLQGVAAFSYAHAPGSFGDLGTTGIKPQGLVNVARHGRIVVQIDTGVATIAKGVDRPYFRFAANAGNTVLGLFSNASDAGNTDATKQGVFMSPLLIAADGSKIAVLELDMTAKP